MNNLDRITAELADVRRVAGEAMDRLAAIIERKDAELAALITEVERLTAERDRYKAWHDEVIDSPTMHHRRGAGKVTQLIVRPQPLKENER